MIYLLQDKTNTNPLHKSLWFEPMGFAAEKVEKKHIFLIVEYPSTLYYQAIFNNELLKYLLDFGRVVDRDINSLACSSKSANWEEEDWAQYLTDFINSKILQARSKLKISQSISKRDINMFISSLDFAPDTWNINSYSGSLSTTNDSVKLFCKFAGAIFGTPFEFISAPMPQKFLDSQYNHHLSGNELLTWIFPQSEKPFVNDFYNITVGKEGIYPFTVYRGLKSDDDFILRWNTDSSFRIDYGERYTYRGEWDPLAIRTNFSNMYKEPISNCKIIELGKTTDPDDLAQGITHKIAQVIN